LAEELRKQWEGVQAGFVDEPREAVRQADELVASAIEELVESFSQARANLEGQLSRGGQTNTEDLRVALKKYRSFFQKLMTV
jgi:F0F1-type ATP synthase membrane subunit b/b'